MTPYPTLAPKSLRMACLTLTLGSWSATAWAATRIEDYLSLSLEELLQVQVSSVSKKSQRLADVAASVYVIDENAIRRSGARSLPEALRLAPGVDAAHISGNRWAVSIRGFNRQFANKLLVMVDGRSVYSPAFSGVFWEALNIPLSEVERIEVIRGPGAAVWGANAVNGVINIITKRADASPGGQLITELGSDEYWSGMVRYGGSLDEDTQYRFYLSADGRGPSPALSGADAHDDVRSARAGFRMDRRGDGRWTWIGDLYRSVSGDTGGFPSFSAGPLTIPLPYTYTQDGDDRQEGFDLLGKGVYRLNGGGELQLQGSWTYNDARITGLGRDRRHILDLDAQHHLALRGDHDLIWGAGLRVTRDHMGGGVLDNGDITSVLSPAQDTLTILSLYGQDEIRLREDVRLTLGARLEHHEYTGLEIQPNVRLLWNLSPTQSLWTSLARAVRTPSRGERSFTYNTVVLPTRPFPTLLTTAGNSDFHSEVLDALEIGHRAQWSPALSTDLVLFLHRYSNLLSTPQGALDLSTLLTQGYVTQPLLLANDEGMTVQGLELALDWRIRPDWRVQASYSFTDALRDIDARNVMPKQVLNLRSSHDLPHNLELSLQLRHVSARRDPVASLYPHDVDAYTALDVRLGWRPRKDLELSLMARELLAGKHLEFINDVINFLPTQVEPSLDLQVKWDF